MLGSGIAPMVWTVDRLPGFSASNVLINGGFISEIP